VLANSPLPPVAEAPHAIDRMMAGIRAWVLLAVVLLISSLPGFVLLPPLDRDESRFSQASVQMLETGDYVRIRYQDDDRNKKPVGLHWLQSASTALITGVEAREIWTYRLPSLLGAIATAWLTFWAGLALMSRRAAFIAGLLMASGILLTTEAHIGKTDSILVASVVWVMGCLAYMRQNPEPSAARRLGWLAWTGLAFGTIIKGPITLMVVGLAFLVLWFWDAAGGRGKAGRAWMAPLFHWLGPLILLALVAPWYIAIQIITNGGFLNEAIGVDLGPKVTGGGEHGSRPPGLHLLLLPLMFFPGIFAVFAGGLAGFRAEQGKTTTTLTAGGARFLIAWAVPSWLVWEAATTKLVHYTLPSQPALALLAGAAFAAVVSLPRDERKRWWMGAALMVFGGAMAAFLCAPFAMNFAFEQAKENFQEALALTTLSPDSVPEMVAPQTPIWPMIMAIALSLAVAVLIVLRRHATALVFAIVVGVGVGFSMRAFILPAQTWMFATEHARTLLDEVCALPAHAERSVGCIETPPPAFIRSFGYNEPSFVFATATNTALQPTSTTDLPPVALEARPVWLINRLDREGLPAEQRVRAAAIAQDRCVTESRPIAAHNYSNGDALLLVVLAVEPLPCAGSG